MIALAHPDVDQAADDVVDAPVHRLVGVHAAVEEQEFAVRAHRRACSAMIRASEIRVWSLICPSRASRGMVRAVSTTSVRMDLLAVDDRSGRAAGQRQRHLRGLAHAVHHARG